MLLKIIIILIVAKWGESFEEKDMICTEDYCRNYKETKGCPKLSEACRVQNSTHNRVILPYPDICNCCDYCIENLALNESCTRGSPGTPPPDKICGPGLYCTLNEENLAICRPMRTNCTKKQIDWDERRKNGTLGMIEVRPKCDDDGQFSPIHCIPGSICYCLSPDGERIFGELPFLDTSDEKKMSCGCSINYWKALKSVNEKFLNVTLTARCTSNGLFDTLQCMMGKNKNCFCVDSETGEPKQGPVAIGDVQKLDCFKSSIHDSEKYETECEVAKVNSNRTSQFEAPKCQPDGKFDRVQIVDKRQICVDPEGNQIDNFSSPIDSSTKIDCNCARTLWLLRKLEISNELPSCTADGSFQPIQRLRNQYFCVNINGEQIGLEKDSESELSCTTSSRSLPQK